MKILAFDTSTSACSVALQNGDLVSVLHQIAPMQHAQLILPMIYKLLGSHSLAPNELDAIAYGCGPGSFTGIRIASSVAQGIGFAIKKPIISVSSLATLAQTAYLEQQWTKLSVAMDARMGKMYWATYEINPSGVAELIGNEQLGSPYEVTYTDKTDMCGIGDGWEMYKETLMKRGFRPKAIKATQLPSAKALLQLAKAKFEQGEWVAASQAVPIYLDSNFC
jgi:tRNA threonylcarbamoyladenosine biosynthesis protein TsaB